ncbi:MAG: hypothetical protein PHT07_16270 [Paludibacter sp.]|nr:hypothetical protein [Paludibacter sp.]
MKKLFSILFAGMILLSGMHLSIASHFCGGELAAVKWSVLDEKAGCGMEMVKPVNSVNKTIEAENCCKDEMSFYALDNNYNPSTTQLNPPVNQLLQVFYIPTTLNIQFLNTNHSTNTNVQPPGQFLASAVKLPDICVFLI